MTDHESADALDASVANHPAGFYRNGHFERFSAEQTGVTRQPVDPAAPSRGRYAATRTLTPEEITLILSTAADFDQAFQLRSLGSAEPSAPSATHVPGRVLSMRHLAARAARIQARMLDEGHAVEGITPREVATTALQTLGYRLEPVPGRDLDIVRLRNTNRYAPSFER